MQKNTTPCYYTDYLGLDKLLDTQHPVSSEYGVTAHDEMLFIITHQAYELWFKQILHELHSILPTLAQKNIDEEQLSGIVARLERIQSIQRVLIEQINVLETMTPLDFLDFRDYLIPASGFQSIQFKEIEILLGLKSERRVNFDKESFYSRLNDTDREYLLKLEDEPSLFDYIQSWLERIPFMQFQDFDFWKSYQDAVNKMLDHDQATIEGADYMTESEKAFQLKDLASTRVAFKCLLDEEAYGDLQSKGQFQLSQKALLSAVFINLYRDKPILQIPFRLLMTLVEIDKSFTTWRWRHMIMVHRMLGSKIGTGGSSGKDYLRSTTENNRFFADLFNLSTFLIPRSSLPELPDALCESLDFHFKP